MIAHVRGIVAEKFASSLVIDAAGVGYEVQVTLADYERAILDSELKLHTYHHVREQSDELFGFSSLAAKKLFELLITVQGVGPKAALAILSIGESEMVRNAIASSDTEFIARATGVGKKTAERVAVDLSDKVGLALRYDNNPATGLSSEISRSDEALEALMALGYTLNDATRALEGIPTNLSTAERVTEALKQ